MIPLLGGGVGVVVVILGGLFGTEEVSDGLFMAHGRNKLEEVNVSSETFARSGPPLGSIRLPTCPDVHRLYRSTSDFLFMESSSENVMEETDISCWQAHCMQ